MKKSLLIYLITWSIASTVQPQSVAVRPFIGYTKINMEEMNTDMKRRIESLSGLVAKSLPYPEPFRGNLMGGFLIEYRAEHQYFFNLTGYFYKEETGVQEQTTSLYFQSTRRIELLDFSIGFRYFFSYSSWKPVAPYAGVGAGYAAGWSEADLVYDDGTNTVDNHGKFSSGSLTACFCAGIAVRINSTFSLYPEVGYRVANLQQMEGTLAVEQTFPGISNGQISAVDDNYITEFNHDFSGFYLSIGLNLVIFSLK